MEIAEPSGETALKPKLKRRMNRKMIALAAAALFVAATAPAAHAQAAPANVAGSWQVSMQGQSAAVSQTLSIEQKGGAISGTIRAQHGNPAEVRGRVTGKNIAFTVKRETPDGEVTQQFAGTVSANSIAGTVTQGQFHVNWTAARAK
jgi:hypothetical protein